MSFRRIMTTALLFVCGAAVTGCTGGQQMRPYGVSMEGNPHHGKQLIVSYGCGSCHTIPGIHAARGLVGPPLMFFGRRTMIAGELPNTQDNLIHWIMDPKSVEPGTAMPNLGIKQDDAKDVAAYLYTLE